MCKQENIAKFNPHYCYYLNYNSDVDRYKSMISYLKEKQKFVNDNNSDNLNDVIKNLINKIQEQENTIKIKEHQHYNLNQDLNNIDQVLLDKHFLRKHGKNAYYGQK